MSEVAIWQPQGAEIAVYEPSGPLDDWIRVADQVVRLAEVICKTPFVPDGLRGNAAATAAAILTGRELKIPPMTSLANIHVIHGKPGLSALVMRALVLSQGHEWQDVDVSNTRVVVRGRRKGETEWTTASFSTADATTARLTLGGYPQDKLYARASARLARRKFADVIAGMPYSIEELEDGIVPDEADVQPDAPAVVIEPAKPRTAQRKQRTQTAPPAPPQHAAAPPHPPSPAEGAGGALPPLPGEDDEPAPAVQPPAAGAAPDDADYDSPGTVTDPMITAIWTVLNSRFGFTKDEKDQARAVCSHIARRELATTKNMSKNEAKAVLDTLAHWQQQAQDKGEHPRDYLIAVMAAQEEASDGQH